MSVIHYNHTLTQCSLRISTAMTRFSVFTLLPLASACLLACAVQPAFAQTAPDAGRTLREQTAPTLQAPRSSEGLRLVTPSTEKILPGGATVTLKTVRVQGNTVLSESELLLALGTVTGQSFDMAGLRDLADRVALVYHDAGYPFTRAYLPQQDLSSGQLTIDVIEGRYGQIKAIGDQTLSADAESFLANLKSGEVIESSELERATLILDDLPGVKTGPVIRPGQSFGTGDLDVEVQRTPLIHGDIGYDNYGNHYSGEHRGRANVLVDSPFMLGDQVQLSGVGTSESLWLGSLGYSLPIGSNGWRGQVSYAHTHYQLGKEFASVRDNGMASVGSIGTTYQWVRSQASNLSLSMSLQHKELQDRQDATGSSTDKTSNIAPISLQFDHRDLFAGGGLSYGNFVFTAGQLKLGPQLKEHDLLSGIHSNGHFQKWNLDVARIQNTGLEGLSLFGRFTGQWSDKNLDSSEKFGLGGANGVRAYPTGEGYGDDGWLAQVELRYAIGDFSPYAFYDAGSIRINAKRNIDRSIAGAGIGSRYVLGPWSVDGSLAWRTEGGRPETDTTNRIPQAWLTTSYRF
ncbi:MAG: ShlB/FhaC/HecB family hemolysin secretion/activation protein [Methylomonas sp.]